MAQIQSKHDVRRKVRDAQAQVNRERLKRESDNREDMVALGEHGHAGRLDAAPLHARMDRRPTMTRPEALRG